MIIDNKCTEIGDVLIIESNVHLNSKSLNISYFEDNIIGETKNRFFEKFFRISQDGFLWTDWEILNLNNLKNLEFELINNYIIFEFRYERKGSNNESFLEFISLKLGGTSIKKIQNKKISEKTIFRGLTCGNFYTTQLCSNLLSKLNSKGIVPSYINRTNDFNIFWATIAHYLSMFVTYMSKFDDIYIERDILKDYLNHFSLNFSEYTELLFDLQYISENMYDEIRKRGTSQVFNKKGFKNLDNNTNNINGEIIRLTSTGLDDEFLWDISNETNCGWNVGNSSPLYKGNCKNINLKKSFENIDNYPLINSNNINYELINNEMCLVINSSTDETGVGFTKNIFDKFFTVSAFLDYEISFSLLSNNEVDISFGVDCFDEYNNFYETLDILTLKKSNRFFKDKKIKIFNTFVPYKGNIYNKDHGKIDFPNNLLNCSFGSNLKFTDKKINRLVPYLTVKSEKKSKVFIKDFNITLLNKKYSLGFLNTNNILQIWSYNNNLKKSFNDIEEIIRKFLIPYNSILKMNLIK